MNCLLSSRLSSPAVFIGLHIVMMPELANGQMPFQNDD
jgi:hypothetical protein